MPADPGAAAAICGGGGHPVLPGGAAQPLYLRFRGRILFPADVAGWRTAANVASDFDYSLDHYIVQAAVLLVAYLFLVWACPAQRRRDRMPRLAGALLILFGAGYSFAFFCTGMLPALGIYTQQWVTQANGFLLNFTVAMRYSSVDKPEDYSRDRVLELAEEYPAVEADGSVTRPVNIIAIMNESWADFESFGNLSLSESVTDFIDSLDNCIRGHCYTSVFGAGTSASEFEFLTGNSMAFLTSDSITYQQNILEPSSSLASLLKENGYRTLAFHPGERTSWQRNQAYPLLGIDHFKCVEDMDVPITEEHGYVSDQSSFEQIIYEFEHKSPQERLILFNVTILNLGSYTVENYPAQVQLTDHPGRYPMAEQYLTLANKTDESFKLLVDYFSRQQQPTIFLMFGDHQPSVEQEFLDKAYGVTQDQMTMEQYMGRYQTPFLIWANYPLPQTELPVSSLNFLGQHLLSLSGIRNSVYGDYLSGLEQQLPAYTFVGYMDADGKAYSHLESNRYDSLIEDYRAFAYNNLFGAQQRCGSFFQPPQ